jgi:hypothetical protein
VTTARYRVLGVAHPGSRWFRDVGRWSAGAALPVDFVRCVAVEELRARLASGRAWSAVLVDGGLGGVDRDLVDQARDAGAAVLVVDDGRRSGTDWLDLGADAVLPDGFDRGALLSALAARAPALKGLDQPPTARQAPPPSGWRGRLVAVTGPGGGGSSTVAMALAQGLGREPRHHGMVVLADLALHADLALLHDAGDVVPGLQELVEAHRTGTPSVDTVRGLTFSVDDRGYDLLLGLRRHRDWPVLRPRAVQAAVDSLLRAYRLVVADVDADLEGDDEVGSVDVEERNVLARTACLRADLVVVVASASLTGVRRLVLSMDELHRAGITADRLLPVVTSAPRRPRVRAELARAVADVLADVDAELGEVVPAPLQLPERRHLDALHHLAAPMPGALVVPITRAVEALLDRAPIVPAGLRSLDPVPIRPGSLGAWSEDDLGDA